MLLLGNQYGVGWVIQLIDDTEILLSCFSKKKKKRRYYWFVFYFLRFYFYPYCLDRHELSCLWPVCGCFGNVGILIGGAECENCLSLCPFFGSDSPRLLLIAINNLAMLPFYFY